MGGGGRDVTCRVREGVCLCEPLGLDTQREGGRLCVCVRQWGQHELALRHGSVCVYVCVLLAGLCEEAAEVCRLL